MSTTASVTSTAAALMPAIFMRNGTPVALRSAAVASKATAVVSALAVSIAELGAVIRAEDSNSGIRRATTAKRYFPTSLLRICHGERRVDGECVGHPGARRRGAHAGDSRPVCRRIRGLV